MSLSPTYGCFGCVDFANNARTKAYVAWACRTGKFKGDPGAVIKRSQALCSCPDDDADWTNPVADLVCWYDAQAPESADFLGVIITGSTGVRGSSFTREVANALNGGSVLQLPVITGKQMLLNVELIATSQAGMNYGIQWLRRQFEGNQRCVSDGSTCASCQGQLLTLRTHCSQDVPGALDDGLHSWAAAGTIDGFEPNDDDFPLGRVHCEKATSGTITLHTEQHDSYSTLPINSQEVDSSGTFTALGNCLINADLPTLDDVCCPICSVGCDPCTNDPGCDCFPPFVLEPETITNFAPCFTDPVCRCIAAIAVENLPSGYETALRVTLRAGMDVSNEAFTAFGMRNVVFRVWENPPTSIADPLSPDPMDPDIIDLPDGLPLPIDLASYDLVASKLEPCAEIGVSWLPAASELVIDGLSGQTWLKCNGKCVDHSRRVETISGTIFPLKAHCTNLIITVEWDCMSVVGCLSELDCDGDGRILSSMLVEAFLGHVL